MIKLSPKKGLEDYVFITSQKPIPEDISPLMTFKEKEGCTYIIEKKDAIAYNYTIQQTWSLISLDYQSDLEMTGLTAAISTALGDAKIPCNVVAAYYHDHIFVPKHLAASAITILSAIRI